DVGDVDALDRLAGDLPVLRILERHFLRRRELRGFAGDLAEARLAAARAMRDHAVGRSALGDRRVPALGGSDEKHLARAGAGLAQDRKSTRLNSSHVAISYAVFCLKKK